MALTETKRTNADKWINKKESAWDSTNDRFFHGPKISQKIFRTVACKADSYTVYVTRKENLLTMFYTAIFNSSFFFLYFFFFLRGIRFVCKGIISVVCASTFTHKFSTCPFQLIFNCWLILLSSRVRDHANWSERVSISILLASCVDLSQVKAHIRLLAPSFFLFPLPQFISFSRFRPFSLFCLCLSLSVWSS